MITANHVPDGPVTFPDGKTYQMTVGSDTLVSNSGVLATGGTPDMRLFRLQTNPGLPSLTVGSSTPAAGTQVMMIGNGHDRASNIIGFQAGGNVLATSTLTPGPLPIDTFTGYQLLNTQHERWGTNRIAAGGDAVVGNSPVMVTSFSQYNGLFTAQATVGDSGGGMFDKVGGHWQLTGLMDAIQPLSVNQPSNVVLYGEQTYTIDLTLYQSQINAIVNSKISAWQNQVNVFDVDRSGVVTPLDLLKLENALAATGPETLTGKPGAGAALLDVNGDGLFNQLDILSELNFLEQQTTGSSALGAARPAPEPSTLVLALSGLLITAYAGRRCYRRKTSANSTAR